MKTLFTLEDHYNFIDDCIKASPKEVVISTFGIWAGFKFDGQSVSDNIMPYTRTVLDKLRSVPKVRVLVSTSSYTSCRGFAPCMDCELKYFQSMLRLLSHVEAYNCFEWRHASDTHLKLMIFIYSNNVKAAVIGGRNFTNSQWADLTFGIGNITRIDEIKSHFDEVWNNSPLITNSLIEKLLADNNISANSIKLMGV